jgi:hypothetical protein
LKNGVFGVRTTCVDEMFGTLGIAICAAPVRSGSPDVVTAAGLTAAAGVAAAGRAGVWAAAWSALRIRPVSTRPAAKPTSTNMKATVTSASRLIMGPT